MCSRVLRHILTVVVLTAGLSAPASGDMLNHVHVYRTATSVGCCWYEQEGPFPVISEGEQLGHEAGWYSFGVSANAGVLQGWTTNHLVGRSTLNYKRTLTAWTEIDDLIFTDGTGVPKPVTFYVKLQVEGAAYATGSGGGFFECRVRVTASGTATGYDGTWEWNVNGDDGSSGWLAGEFGPTISGVYTVGPFTATSEQPVTLRIQTDTVSAPSLGHGVPGPMVITGHAFVNFALGQFAIVSSGFDANSEQAGIVDNVYGALLSTDPPAMPRMLQLAQNAPNPARGSTRISFVLPTGGHASLALYDIAGREVRRLADRRFEAGQHAVQWDGTDSHGTRVRPGVYLYRLRQGEAMLDRSMVVVGP